MLGEKGNRSIMDRTPVYAGTPVSGAPYTPGIQVGNLVFVSGQVPLDAATNSIVRDDFERAVNVCLDNVARILQSAGTDLGNCVRVGVFLANMDNFARLNAVYASRFGEVKPARTCIQAQLPLGVDVEIEAIALIP